jgi:hypothetical protein
MKKYFIQTEKGQSPALNIEDLKVMNLPKNTPVWFEGASNWTTLEQVEEIKSALFPVTPPPFSKPTVPPPYEGNTSNANTAFNQQKLPPANPFFQNQKPKKKNVGLIVGVCLLIFVLLSGGLYAYAKWKQGKDSDASSTNDYYEAVMTVEEKEKANPQDFISAEGTYRDNFWGDAIKMSVVLSNTATVANFKDIKLKVTFYSKTDTELDVKYYTIYENLPAHSTITHQMKIARPQNCEKLSWACSSATSY